MKDAHQEKGKVFFLKAKLETFQKDTLNVTKENAFEGCFKERNAIRPRKRGQNIKLFDEGICNGELKKYDPAFKNNLSL